MARDVSSASFSVRHLVSRLSIADRLLQKGAAHKGRSGDGLGELRVQHTGGCESALSWLL